MMADQPLKKPIFIAGFGASSMRGWRPGVHNYQTFRAVFERKLCDNGIPAVIYDAAQPGNTVIAGQQRFERDVLSWNPDAVIISFALNDSAIDPGKTTSRVSPETFREIYQNWLTVLAGSKISTVLLLPQLVFTENYETKNKRLRLYIDILRELGVLNKVPVIDVFHALEAAQKNGVDIESFYIDKLHFNAKGHQFAADCCMEFEKQTGFFKTISDRINP